MVEIKENNISFSDPDGFSTLDTIASADRFNRWMYQTIAPFCTGHILEIGGGIGNISRQVLADAKKLTITELRSEYCRLLHDKLSDSAFQPEQIICLDIVDQEFDEKYASLVGQFDTVFALNVVEHIADHQLAIANCKKLLRPGGQLIILVPAFQFLFNSFDRALDHQRRYTKKSLRNLFYEAELSIVHQQYFNFSGTLGWWFSGNLLRKKVVPEGQMSLYNKLVPVFKLVDWFFRRWCGLSVIVVGQKNEKHATKN